MLKMRAMPKVSRTNTLIRPALGPSSRIQAITEMKFGITNAISTATRTNCRAGMSVRDTAQAIGNASSSAKPVVATLMMIELTSAETRPGSVNTRW
jgi:hypothetical protein